MKTCLIIQPAGLGDIFFCQKIATHYSKNLGFKVIWPVYEHFLYIKDYIKNDVEFIKHNSNINYNSFNFVLKLEMAGRLLPGTVQEVKYTLAKVSFEDWANYFNFERNVQRENNLYYDILNLKDNSEFVLVNRNFASPPGVLRKEFKVISSHLQIEMKILEDSHLFDWCKVLEKAKGIYTMDTAIQYIIEKLDIMAELHVWSRFIPATFDHLRNLFKKPWQENYD